MYRQIMCAGLCASALVLTSCFPFSSETSNAAQPEPVVAAAPDQASAAAPAPAAAVKKQPAAKAKATAKAGKKQAAKAGPPSEAQARAELDDFLVKYTQQANKNMNGSRSKPRVFTRGKNHVAQFSEIDPVSVHADMRKSISKHFDYTARMYYVENTFECVGKTKKEALKGPFKVVNSKKLTELPRYYKGKWEN
jgi:hypothetical protein